MTPEAEDAWLIDGDVHLDELRRAIGRDLPQPDVETVAALLIAERGALPAEGDRVTIPLPIDPAELADRHPTRWLLEVDVLRVERHAPATPVHEALARMRAASVQPPSRLNRPSGVSQETLGRGNFEASLRQVGHNREAPKSTLPNL